MHNAQNLIVGVSISLLFACAGIYAQLAAHQESAAVERIKRIDVYGNKRTNRALVMKLLELDTATAFDSTAVAEAKTRLRKSNLFSTADIFPQKQADGIRLLVVLVERPYLSISDIGGTLYSGKYGYDTIPGSRDGNWFQRLWNSPWKVRLGVSHANFGGRMEVLGVHATLWQWRSLALSWYKPFVGTPWYLHTAATMGFSPDLNIPLDHFSIAARASVGRKIGERSKIYGGFVPAYNKYRWLDSSLNTDSIAEFYEAYALAGVATDFRNASFDTRTGWYSGIALSTNWLYPRDREFGFLQLSADQRLYHPGFWENHAAAYRLTTILRAGKGGLYNALYAGGSEHNLRGYGVGYLPRSIDGKRKFTADNRMLLSAEYRFSLFKTPAMDFGSLNALHPGLRGFYYRFDGAFIADGAWLWQSLLDPLHEEKDLAASLGAGIRIMAPTIKRAISFDVMWGVVRPDREWDILRQYGWKRFQPSWYLYVDLPY